MVENAGGGPGGGRGVQILGWGIHYFCQNLKGYNILGFIILLFQLYVTASYSKICLGDLCHTPLTPPCLHLWIWRVKRFFFVIVFSSAFVCPRRRGKKTLIIKSRPDQNSWTIRFLSIYYFFGFQTNTKSLKPEKSIVLGFRQHHWKTGLP